MKPETKALLDAIVRRHYAHLAYFNTNFNAVDGDQIVDCEWFAPRWGCDTLDNLIADIGEAIDERQSKLETAIRETLEENAHLADGENCTLRKLKEALQSP